MKESYPEAIDFVMAAEGWYSNNALDPGKGTILGISSVWWPAEYAIIKDMIPTDAREYARNFYHAEFWTPLACDDLAHPLDVCAFDASVNMGLAWPRITLKITQNWQRFLDLREQRYRALAVSKPEFLKGWLNRCETLRNKYKAFA